MTAGDWVFIAFVVFVVHVVFVGVCWCASNDEGWYR